MNRRDFVKASGLLAASSGWSAPTKLPRGWVGNEVNPTATQRTWMDPGFGLFIHFGINTYYDVEWSDGTLDPG